MKVGDKIVWIHSINLGQIQEGTVARISSPQDASDCQVWIVGYESQYADFIYKKFCYPIERKAELLKAVQRIKRAEAALRSARINLANIPQ